MEFSSRQRLRRIPRHVLVQVPSFLSSRKDFSTTSHQNAPKGPGSTGKPPESRSNLTKIVIGSVVIGAAALTAYQTGYLDQLTGKEPHSSRLDNKVAKDARHLEKPIVLPNCDEPNKSTANEHAEQNVETHDVSHLKGSSEMEGEDRSHAKEELDMKPEENITPIQPKDMPEYPNSIAISDEQNIDSRTSAKGSRGMKNEDTKPDGENNEKVEITQKSIQSSTDSEENETKATSSQQLTTKDMPEDSLGKGAESPSSLLDEYYIKDKADESTASSSNGQGTDGYKEKEASVKAVDSNDAYVTKDGKLILDFLQAIHVAEKRQAELDARVFSEEKRMIKEKYEKELKDARVRELMYAEEAAIMEKDLNNERLKAAAAIKSLQEKAEQKLQMELEQKENEAELKLKEVQELAKAELAAAIASEKASQIEKMAEANVHIDALCMAFFARSEEARQSHSVHKLALGALALEDALSEGLPVEKDLEAMHTYLDGVGGDSLINLVISSIPDETRKNGSDTLLQLKNKFDTLKGSLRHFSLIPPGGGGILAHSLAYIASAMKVKEADRSGDGIESIINRVESYLAEGNLGGAAEILEQGVRGSQAEGVVGDWVTRARNRAITEQALTVIQAYCTSINQS